MEFRQYFSVVWKWLWLMILAALVAGGISYIVTSHQPKVYQASTKLLVGRSIQTTNPNSQDIQTSQQLALTYTEIAKTSSVLQGAIDALHINMSAAQLGDNLSATNIPDPQLIELRVSDTDPARAQALANELGHQLILVTPNGAQQGQSGQRDFVQQQVQDLPQKIQQGNKNLTDLQNQSQAGLTQQELTTRLQEINALQTQLTIWQQAYASLLPYLGNDAPNYISVVDPAQLPDKPVSPNVPLSTLLAAATGLILGIAAAFLLEYLNDGLKTADDVKQALKLPALGVISRIKAGKQGKLVDGLSPLSPTVEAYRTLRYNLQLNGKDNLKTILVTSPGTGEGKSLTAANLAVIMAQSGMRTILVDADLRKPAQHLLFGLHNEVGLTSHFMPTPPSTEIVRATRVENLCLVTSGLKPLNPAELLSSERMRKFLTRLQNESDVVIVDSPPCLNVVDTTLLARQVDGVVMVVDGKRTPRRLARKAQELIESSGARLAGVILNRADTRGTQPYYG